MLRTNVVALVTIGVLASSAAAQIDCNSNFTIHESSKLKEVIDNCNTIGGLTITPNFTGHIDFSGIETIKGDFSLFQCDVFACDEGSDDLVNVSSSSLKQIGAWLQIQRASTIEFLKLPKLRKVERGFLVEEAGNLTEIDISDLTDVEYLRLKGTQKLERIKSGGIRNFTSTTGNGQVNLDMIDKLESVGDLLAMNATQANASHGVDLFLGSDSNTFKDDLATYTLGWPRIDKVQIHGAPTITFGGEDTTDMHIYDAYFDLGAKFKRHDDLRNITIDSLFMGPADDTDNDQWLKEQETIEVPFDDVGRLDFTLSAFETNTVVKRFSLPERASGWGEAEIALHLSRTKFEAKKEVEGEDEEETVWHWPKVVGNVTLEGMINMDTMETFKEQDCHVRGDFQLTSTNDGLDCDELEKDENVTSRIDGVFRCSSNDRGYDDAAGTRAAQLLPVLGLAALAGVFLTL